MTSKKNAPNEPLPVRDLAKDVYHCLLLDIWPTPAGINDFGLDSEEHYGALQLAIRTGEVSVEDLDAALGYGPAITALIAEDNPYHGVSFVTTWDSIMVPIASWAGVAETLFPFGRLFATPAVLDAVGQAGVKDALRRHAVGDWGDGDAARNEDAVRRKCEGGLEILSLYEHASGVRFCVRTAYEPVTTLVILEEEADF